MLRVVCMCFMSNIKSAISVFVMVDGGDWIRWNGNGISFGVLDE